jgi:ketosteroid isomerase-like protein
MNKMNIDTVKGIYDGFARRDVPATLAALADDIEWYEAEGLPWGGLQRGPAAVAQNVFAPAIARVPDLAVVPEEIIESGDTIAISQRYTGSSEATGKRLDLIGVGLWDLREGKVVRYRQFVDTVKFREIVPA